MDMETGTAGDDDEKMTEAEKAGGGSRVTAQRVSAAADATRREEPTVNQEKIRLALVIRGSKKTRRPQSYSCHPCW